MSTAGILLTCGLGLAALAALRWPQVGACGVLVLDFMRPQDWEPGLGEARPALVLGLATSAGLLVELRRRRPGIRHNGQLADLARLLLPWATLAAVAVLSTLAADQPAASVPALVVLLKRLVWLPVAVVVLSTPGRLRAAGWSAAGGAAVLAAEALLRATTDGIPELVQPGQGGVTGPPGGGDNGLFHDNNGFARLLAMSLPLWAMCSATSARGRAARITILCGAALTLIALVATYSRSGFVAGVAILLIALSRLRPLWKAGAGAAAALVLFLLLPSSYHQRVETVSAPFATDSMQARLHVWEIGLAIASQSPLVGVGPGGWRAHYPPGEVAYRSAHNVLVQVLAELGALGLLAYLWVFADSLAGLERLRRRPPPAASSSFAWSGAAGSLQLSLVAFLVSSLALSHPFWEPAVDVLALASALRFAAASRASSGP